MLLWLLVFKIGFVYQSTSKSQILMYVKITQDTCSKRIPVSFNSVNLIKLNLEVPLTFNGFSLQATLRNIIFMVFTKRLGHFLFFNSFSSIIYKKMKESEGEIDFSCIFQSFLQSKSIQEYILHLGPHH